MKFVNNSTSEFNQILKNQTEINTTATTLNPVYNRNQTIFLKRKHLEDKVFTPLKEQREKVFQLERQLFESINLQWDIDIITEDVPIIDNIHNDYYIHLLRTANPDPNKENFLLIHGFLSCNLYFLGILPYLLKRYRFNIKKEYYLCGHSLGGFLASRYMLLYPEGIKKVLLLSPAGITDYRIPGTDYFRDSSNKFFCCAVCCTSLVWPCQLRVQNLYNCCCFHNIIRNHYGIKKLNIYKEEIKPNPDGSEFKIDYVTLRKALNELTVASLDYPKDLYRCAYYMFAPNAPAALLPAEQKIRDFNKLQCIICFGQYDFMDKIGSYRLKKFNPERYKVFTISNGGHNFVFQNPKELCTIIEQYFNDS